ncbi:transmembrane protein 236 [Thalassophryne amazonica]|uniref:transmembrane protein 236 n=1 Tax=Thalassophryne amazonica TaxID=390379 RepID=UPI0014718AD7|nr:transmembrane protein 236 [Thalassophryne amazonica]
MPSRKTIKLVVYEVLEFAALSIPIFVITEKFARLVSDVERWDEISYWLVVAASIAYVTSVALLVWLPLKYLKKRYRSITETAQWRPIALAYLVLCTLPCFAVLIASSKVQVDGGQRIDQFTELPVSLVLFCLICVDVIERIRSCSLTGHYGLDSDFDMSGPVLTHLGHVNTVSGLQHPDGGQNGMPHGCPETRNGVTSGRLQDANRSSNHLTYSSRVPDTAYLYSSRSHSHSGRLSFLWKKDSRAEMFVDSFLFWFDTVEMVRVVGEPSVFYSAWVLPVYILAFLSAIRVAIAPQSRLLSIASVVLQDFPFFIFRVVLIAVFGYVTPVLYALKNVLVSLSLIYFTFLTKLKPFRRECMF